MKPGQIHHLFHFSAAVYWFFLQASNVFGLVPQSVKLFLRDAGSQSQLKMLH